MADGFTKARITQLHTKIAAAGLTAPDVSALGEDLDKQEALLKDFWTENKPEGFTMTRTEAPAPPAATRVETPPPPVPATAPQDLGTTSDKEAIEIMKAQIAALTEAVTKAAAPQGGGITMDALEKLLEKQSSGKITMNSVREGYVPPGEALAEPVVFWTPQQNDYLSFRYEGGMVVTPPHGLAWIKFDNRFRWSVKSGDTYKVRAISAYICRSKPVYDFILKHHKFNNTIFLDTAKAIGASEHGEWMQQYTRFYGSLVNMADVRLPKMAAQLGLPTGVDTLPDRYREMIAEEQTKQYFAGMRNSEEDFHRERASDAMLTATAPRG